MSYKDTNITNPGTSIKYGADDMEIIARLLNGTTSGPHPVKIKSTNKWGFWDNILYVRNQADTFDTTIRGAATMTNNFTLALPNQTTNDTLAAVGLTNVWGVKQQMEQGLTLKQQSTPSNPASTYHHLYMNSSQHLIRRNSSGVEIDYDTSVGAAGQVVLRDYSARVFNTGGTYFAYDALGTLLSSGSTFETVAQAALNQRGTVLFAGPTTLACSGSFVTLDVLDKTHIVIERGCTITVPQGFTGTFLTVEDVDKVILECNGLIQEAGSPARNWHGVLFSSGTMPVMNSHIMHLHVKDAKEAVWVNADGASALVQTNSFNHITAENCRVGVLMQEANGGSVDMNMFMDVMITPLLGTTTHGFKNVSGDMNEFHGCMVMDNDGTIVEMNILNSANNTLLIGGNIGMMREMFPATFDDDSLTTAYFNAGLQLRLDSGYFKMRNVAGTFITTVTNPTQTGDFEIKIPTLSKNSTFAILEDHQTFQDGLDIERDGTDDVLDIHREDNVVGNRVAIDLQLDDSTNATTNYARIAAEIQDNTNPSEDGILRFYVAQNGTLANCLTIDQLGALLLGGPNTRIKFVETGLTAPRTYTFPDADTTLIGSAGTALLAAANIFTAAPQTVAVNTPILLKLFNNITSANGTNTQLDFAARDSGTNEHVFASIRSEVVDNTNASEDGRLEFLTSVNGSLTEHMLLDSGGLSITTGGVFATRDGNATLLDLYRTDNAATNAVDVNFYLEDSANNKTLYSKIAGEIVSNTNGSEDGQFAVYVRTDDVLVKRMIMNDTGLLEIFGKSTQQELLQIYRDSNTTNNTADIGFYLEDSSGNKTNYSAIGSRIQDNTNGTEDGALEFWNMRAGTLTRAMTLDEIGGLVILGSSALADPIIMHRPTATLGSTMDINYDFNNSVGTEVTYCDLRTELVEDNNGAEEGKFMINVMQAGAKEEMLTLTKGRLFIGDAATGTGSVSRNYTRSGSPNIINTTSSETNMFSQTIVGGDMGADGVLHLRILFSIKQNQATGTTWTFRVKFGATTMWADVTASIAQSALFMPGVMDLYIFNTNDATHQEVQGFIAINDITAATNGSGDISDDEGQSFASIGGSSNINTASNATLAVTVQHSVSNVQVETYVSYRWLQLNPS